MLACPVVVSTLTVDSNSARITPSCCRASSAKVAGGTAPIAGAPGAAYANPLPHALILTAIVVGISTTAVGLALIIRIHQAYGTLEEDEIAALDHPPTDGRPTDSN